METNLIELAQRYLTPDVIEKASPLVGESPAITKRALDAATPALAGAVADEASSIPGAQRLLRVLDEAGLEGPMKSITERLGGKSGAELVELGKDLLHRVLGPRAGSVVDATARSSGVQTSTMETLMGLATPVFLGVLGAHVHAHGLGPGALAGLLAEQKGAIPTVVSAKAAVPTVVSASPPRRPAPPIMAPRAASEGPSRLWPLLLLPILVLGLLLFRRREAPLSTREAVPERVVPAVPAEPLKPQAPLPAAAPPPAEAPKPAEPPKTVEPPKTAEPPKTVRPAPPARPVQPRSVGTVGSDLAQFLAGSGGEPTRRFVADNLDFEFATTELTPPSLATLEAVATALRAHPGSRVLLEGHTDAIGLPAANERLSLQRAETIKNALVARGVAADRITTRGFGQDRPLASNDTPEGRAENRRIEIVVTR